VAQLLEPGLLLLVGVGCVLTHWTGDFSRVAGERCGHGWGKSRPVLQGRPEASTLGVRLDSPAKRFLAGKRGRIKAQLRVEVRDDARNAITVTKQVVYSP
jgi:hypothetical protein